MPDKTYKIAAIPGDGIGTEVIEAGVEVIKVLAEREDSYALEVETFPWGADYYLEHGEMMPKDGRETLKAFDAIYFGSAGDPRIPDHITLWELRLNICQGFDQYARSRHGDDVRAIHNTASKNNRLFFAVTPQSVGLPGNKSLIRSH